MTDGTCPVCGTAVRVVGSDEGTQHYEPLASSPAPAGLDVEAAWELVRPFVWPFVTPAERQAIELNIARVIAATRPAEDAWERPCGRCGKSEIDHDGAWAFGHHYEARP